MFLNVGKRETEVVVEVCGVDIREILVYQFENIVLFVDVSREHYGSGFVGVGFFDYRRNHVKHVHVGLVWESVVEQQLAFVGDGDVDGIVVEVYRHA